MAYQKLQSGAGLTVIPSDKYDIPNHAPVYTGTTTGSGTNRLIDSNQVFSDNVFNYIVYDYTSGFVTVAERKFNDTTLVLSDNILTAGEDYAVFPNTHSGCVLYVGVGGDIKVTTSGGSTLTFKNVQDGTFMPISVQRVWATDTTATDIVALW